MTYDAANDKLVLFGGNGDNREVFSGVWEWKEEEWFSQHTELPEGRSSHALIYDPVSGKTLLFGGVTEDGMADNTTWLWDGQQWERHTGESPSERHSPAIAYDKARKTIVLFSGSMNGDDELWEWANGTWTHITLEGDRLSSRMA